MAVKWKYTIDPSTGLIYRFNNKKVEFRYSSGSRWTFSCKEVFEVKAFKSYQGKNLRTWLTQYGYDKDTTMAFTKEAL